MCSIHVFLSPEARDLREFVRAYHQSLSLEQSHYSCSAGLSKNTRLPNHKWAPVLLFLETRDSIFMSLQAEAPLKRSMLVEESQLIYRSAHQS